MEERWVVGTCTSSASAEGSPFPSPLVRGRRGKASRLRVTMKVVLGGHNESTQDHMRAADDNRDRVVAGG